MSNNGLYRSLAALLLMSLFVLGAFVSLLGPERNTEIISRSEYDSGEKVVGFGNRSITKTKYINDTSEPFKYGDNLIIEGNGKLIMRNAQLEMLNDEDFQYNIMIKDSGVLEMKNSEIFCQHRLHFNITDQGRLIMTDGSLLNFGGSVHIDAKEVFLEDSRIGQSSNKPGIDINVNHLTLWGSQLEGMGDLSFFVPPGMKNDDNNNNDYFSIIDSSISTTTSRLHIGTEDYPVGPTVQPLEVINSTVPELYPMNNETVVYIYRWLNIHTRDGAGIPVGGCEVNYKYHELGLENLPPIEPPSMNVQEYLGLTDPSDYNVTTGSGLSKIAMISDTISEEIKGGDPYFVGNYDVFVEYDDQYSSKTYNNTAIVVLHDFPTGGGDSASPSNHNVTFSKVLIPPDTTFYKQKTGTGFDITEEKIVQSDVPSDGNIKISGDGELKVIDSVLTLAQNKDARYYILITDNGKLELDGSKIESQFPVNVYIYDNAQLIIKNANNDMSMNLNTVGARGNTRIQIENSEITSNINTQGSETVIKGSSLSPTKNAGDNMDKLVFTYKTYMIFDDNNLEISGSEIDCSNGFISFDLIGEHYDTIDIKNSVIKGKNEAGSLLVTWSKITVENTTLDNLALDKGALAVITNVNSPGGGELVPNIRDTNSTVKKYWWFTVNVTDKNGAPVGGLEREDEAFVKISPEEQNDYSTVATEQLDSNGQAHFWALSNITTKDEGDSFYGRYKIEATFKESSEDIMEKSTVVSVNRKMTVDISFDRAPELHIDDIYISRKVYVGEPITIDVYLHNYGDMAATYVSVEFYSDGEMFESTLLNTVPVTTDPDRPTLSQGIWEPTKSGGHDLEVRVDSENYNVTDGLQILVYSESDKIVRVNDTIGGQEKPEIYASNILVEGGDGGAVLNIDGMVTIQQEHDRQYQTTVVQDGQLNIVGGKLVSNHAMDIYLEDEAELTIKDSVVDLSGGTIKTTSLESVKIVIENSILRADLSLVGNSLDVRNSRLLEAADIEWSFGNIEIHDSMVSFETMNVLCTSFNSSDSMFEERVPFKGHTEAHLTNVSDFDFSESKKGERDEMADFYYSVNDFEYNMSGSAKLTSYWWLNVEAYDALSMPVSGAEAKVLDKDTGGPASQEKCMAYDPATGQLVSKSFIHSNEEGRARFRLRSSIETADTLDSSPNYDVMITAKDENTGNWLTPVTKEVTVLESNDLAVFNFTEVLRKPTSYQVIIRVGSTDYNMGDEVNLSVASGDSLTLSISVIRVYNGQSHGYASEARVNVTLIGGETRFERTDQWGNLTYNLKSPKQSGTYRVIFKVTEEDNEDAEISREIKVTVEPKSSQSTTPEDQSWVGIAIGIIIVVVVLIIVLVMVMRLRRQRKDMWYDEDEEMEEEDEDEFF